LVDGVLLEIRDHFSQKAAIISHLAEHKIATLAEPASWMPELVAMVSAYPAAYFSADVAYLRLGAANKCNLTPLVSHASANCFIFPNSRPIKKSVLASLIFVFDSILPMADALFICILGVIRAASCSNFFYVFEFISFNARTALCLAFFVGGRSHQPRSSRQELGLGVVATAQLPPSRV